MPCSRLLETNILAKGITANAATDTKVSGALLDLFLRGD
jgi:hypothetical protein